MHANAAKVGVRMGSGATRVETWRTIIERDTLQIMKGAQQESSGGLLLAEELKNMKSWE